MSFSGGGAGGGRARSRRHVPAGMGAKIEKPRDARRAIMGLLRYLGPFKVALVFVLITVVIYTALGLVGPFLLGIAIDRYITPKNAAGLPGSRCSWRLHTYWAPSSRRSRPG